MERYSENRQSNEDKEHVGIKALVFIRRVDDAEGATEPLLLNSAPQNELAEFLISEKGRLEEDIQEKRIKSHEFSSQKRHGRDLDSKTVTQARESLEGQIESMQEIVKTLKGKTLRPIIVKKVEGEFSLEGVGSFDYKEAGWWGFVRENSDVLNLADEDLERVREFFEIRTEISRNNPDAKEELDNFRERLGDDESLDQYLRIITREYFSG